MRRLSICLILPRFEPSYFGREYMLPILPGDKRCMMIGGGLPLLAALVPDGHTVSIVDENVEKIDFAAVREFDVVGITGMIVQKHRMDQILEKLSGMKGIVCVGGPYATVDEQHFKDRCDVLFVGEADETWPRFLDDVASGRPFEHRYKQDAATDMSRLPTPRFDMVKTKHYASASIQFSRGCPFLCEFCDIIVIFGRKPRAKQPTQILAELDALLRLGVRHVFFVDDNFIGNKALAKALLRELVKWQQRQSYPMTFSTEATLNLADEAELMELMWRANFSSVFIGIESPRRESLLETRKVQNVRGDSIDAKLDRLRDAGIIVSAGFIVGFDNDDERVFEEQFDFIQRNGIGLATVSILSPIPSTPLYERLERDGRLVPDDEVVWFEPKLMSRETLKQRYAELNLRLYAPEAFFERLFQGYGRSTIFRKRHREREVRHKRVRLKQHIVGASNSLAMFWRLSRAIARERLLGTMGRAYLRAYMAHNKPFGRDAMPLAEFLALCARHWHHFKLAAENRSYWGRAGTRILDLSPMAEPEPALVRNRLAS
jgi:radical SAM superfamily enzyme YgiQ (UPF0313 family)